MLVFKSIREEIQWLAKDVEEQISLVYQHIYVLHTSGAALVVLSSTSSPMRSPNSAYKNSFEDISKTLKRRFSAKFELTKLLYILNCVSLVSKV